MSKVRADSYTNRAGDGAPTFTYGSVVTGIQTAGTFKGAGTELTGTANNLTAANAQGLSGTPSITINALTASSGSVSGNFNIGGTLTYEDVTNIDSVGLITARSGINVLAGISTFKGANFNGTNIIKEKCHVVAGKLSDTPNIDLENGMVQLYTTADTTICTPDLRMSASVSLNSVLDVGDTIVVTLMSTAAAAAFSAQVTIDTAAVTEKWVGGAAPTAGGAAGIDTYTYTITKLSNTPTWNVIANVTNAA
jgi:hypothetical protein